MKFFKKLLGISKLEEENEQLRVQLAGVSTAAYGWGTGEPPAAVKGMWGWSVAYQDVLMLRRKYDALRHETSMQSLYE